MESVQMREPRWHLPLLVLLGFPIFFYGLGSYSVVNGDEGFYHSIASLMVERGDWFYLDYFGQHRVYDTFMNAPLQYWARAVLITVIGDNLWSMRLLSALFGLLTVLAVHRLTAAIDPSAKKWGALFAALIQLTCFQFVYLHSARTGELDSIVAFLMTATALSFLHAVRGRWSFLPHHLCLAVLLTIKVPAIAIPILAELALFATTASMRPHFKRYVASGLAIVPLGLIWHVFQAGWWWDEFLVVMRKMGAEASGAKGGGDFSGSPLSNLRWYAQKLSFGAFPWSLAMLPAIGAATLVAFKKLRQDEGLALRVALYFALVVWIFFAFVSKRFSWYILPSVPFLAACTGWWLARCFQRYRWTSALVLAAIGTCLVWLRVPIEGLRPLADRAPRIPMDLFWREVAQIETFNGFWLVLAILAIGFLAANRFWPKRGGMAICGGLFVVLLILAGYRVTRPLGDLEHVSELDQLYRLVEADRAAGRAVDYPLVIPESMGFLRIRHYFGRDYLVERRSGGPRGVQILILGEKPKPILEMR